jgi:uncharacterized protein (UPF0335 family)
MPLNRDIENTELHISFRGCVSRGEFAPPRCAYGTMRAGSAVARAPPRRDHLPLVAVVAPIAPPDAPTRRLTRVAGTAMPPVPFSLRLNGPGMSTDNAGTEHVNAAHLRAFIERIEKLEEEKKAIAEDIKEVYGEAKGTGFDVKILRKIVSIRKQDRDKRREEEEILDLYLSALGIE